MTNHNHREKLRILYFGIYDPEYARNRVIIKGLKQNGVQVVECNVPAKAKWKLAKLFIKWLKMRADYDLMIVGFPGQEVMFLARLLTFKPLVFDAFTSHYGGYILDRRYFKPSSWRAKYYRFLDKWSCRLANLVLLDTQAHIDFFVRVFKLPAEKFMRVFVGTDDGLFYPREKENVNASFYVHFHGSYTPLQGVSYIIRAAKLLESENIVFNLIGRGQTYNQVRKLAADNSISNVNFFDPVPYEKLPALISQADISLGIFGDSPKTSLVIPNKVYEAVAMAKTVITADTPAIRELFDDQDMVLVKPADPESLAAGILKLKNDPSLREKLAQNGYAKFINQATPKVIGLELKNYLLSKI